MLDLVTLLQENALDPSVSATHWVETFARLATAVACGICIGWERESKCRPAGLRTHVLIAIGACVFTLAALGVRAEEVRMELPKPDVLKVVGAIAGGVGFLGAGAIIQSRGEISGLTTAAGIWVVASLGVAAGLADFALVGIAAALALFTLVGLAIVERHAFDDDDS